MKIILCRNILCKLCYLKANEHIAQIQMTLNFKNIRKAGQYYNYPALILEWIAIMRITGCNVRDLCLQ